MCSLCITSITNINASSLAGYGGFLVFGNEGGGGRAEVLAEVGRYGDTGDENDVGVRSAGICEYWFDTREVRASTETVEKSSGWFASSEAGLG